MQNIVGRVWTSCARVIYGVCVCVWVGGGLGLEKLLSFSKVKMLPTLYDRETESTAIFSYNNNIIIYKLIQNVSFLC